MRALLWAHRISNSVQSMALLALMFFLFAAVGMLIAGWKGLLFSLGFSVFVFVMSPRVSPAIILKMYHARPFTWQEAVGLYRIVEVLSRRAGLSSTPQLYYMPSTIMNAFSVGRKSQAAIALTDGLLRQLTGEELIGVLAHEVGHISHDDLWIMGVADMLSRLTHVFASIGQFVLLLYIPLYFFGEVKIPFVPLLLLLAAPTVSILLQLALSRTREYRADLAAARLAGDSRGLINALEKIDRYPLSIWNLLLLPGNRGASPSILRTHPRTDKRVARLMKYASSEAKGMAYQDFVVDEEAWDAAGAAEEAAAGNGVALGERSAASRDHS